MYIKFPRFVRNHCLSSTRHNERDHVRASVVSFLDRAAANGTLFDAVSHLLRAGGSPQDLTHACVWAARHGQLDSVNRLLDDERTDPSAKNNEAICLAARHGHQELVDRLLDDERVNPSVENNEAMRMAARHGHREVVDRLLSDERVDPGAQGNYALLLAAEHTHLEVVDRLVLDPRILRVGPFEELPKVPDAVCWIYT